MLDMESGMEAEDFADDQKVKAVYYPEIQIRLLEYFGAKRVEILEHQVCNLLNVHCGRDIDGIIDTETTSRVSRVYW